MMVSKQSIKGRLVSLWERGNYNASLNRNFKLLMLKFRSFDNGYKTNVDRSLLFRTAPLVREINPYNLGVYVSPYLL